MINLPYNVPVVAQIMPTQSTPVQTSQNNLQPFQQPQTVTQQMQTSPVAFPGNPQDSYKPFYQLHQSDVMFTNQQYIPNPALPRNPYHQIPQTQTIPNPPVAQTQASCGQLPASIVEQIRSAVSNTAPIFILPGGCHQPASQQQQQQPPPVYPSNQGGVSPATGPSTGFNYPPSIYCPPSFVPYPIPLPLYEPFTGLTRGKETSQACGCCRHREDSSDTRHNLANSFWNPNSSQEHYCTVTNDDTVCSKRNCPASLSLQALASQFLSLPGIISCAATRLILRKVHGSNIVNTMEEIMEKAQKAISLLTKDQLLVESRIAQQVNALINLHATTNVPARIIPLLMLVQAKVNVLKAQVENLVNRKVMECQGYGFEVETSGPIDPAILSLKSNAELRQLLGALQQKECDERVNVNFAPYHSQRVVAESRLHNVRAKIRQVECEFENRRQVTVPVPTLTSQIIRQFSESRCTFGYAPAKLFEPCVVPDSPDPFSPAVTNPRRLYIKPHQPEPPSSRAGEQTKETSTCPEEPPTRKDTGTGEDNAQCCTKDQSVGRRCSKDSCICDESSSEDNLNEDKKKLRPLINQNSNLRIVERITILETQFEEDPSNLEDANCRPCEASETLEEDNNEEEKGSKASLTIEQLGGAEDGDEESLRVEEDSKTEKLEEPEVAEADEAKEEHSDKEEQVVSQIPEDLNELRALQPGNSEQEDPNAIGKKTKGKKSPEKKGYANIRVIKADDVKKFDRMIDRVGEEDLEDEPKTQNENKNVQIVLMMTNVEYDRSAGDFGRCMMANKCGDKKFEDVEHSMKKLLRVDNPENSKNENYPCLLAGKVSSSKVEVKDEEERGVGSKTCLEDVTGRQSMVMESLGSHNQKVTGKFKHFPPLKQAKSNTRLTRVSQFVPHRVQPDSSRNDRDGSLRSTSGHREASFRNGVASAIRSMIGDRLDYVSSLVDNVPNLQTILSNLYLNKLWNADGTLSLRQSNAEPNKTATSRKDDWILLPTDIDRRTETQTRECYVPLGNKLYRVRKIRHTIIRNRGNKSYLVIGGSASGQLRELSGIGLIEPSRIRRSFVIRSRLKDPKFKQLHPSPLVTSRRFKMSTSPESKDSDRRLKPSEKFCSLSDSIKNSSDFHSREERNNVDTEAWSSVDAENDGTNNYNVVCDDQSAAESEQITNIYDYSAEQEQSGV